MAALLVAALPGLPLIGALAALALPGARREARRHLAAGVAAGTALLGLAAAWLAWRGEAPVLDLPWADALGARLALRADGVALWPLLAASLITLGVLEAGEGRDRRRAATILLLLAALAGGFLSVDLLLYAFLWVGAAVAAFLLAGAWGGARRIYAAQKMLILSMASGLLILGAGLHLATACHARTGLWTCDPAALAAAAPAGTASGCALALILAMALRLPLAPFHTWLADLLAAAPPGSRPLLAAMAPLTAVHGLLRLVLPLQPAAPWLPVLAAAGAAWTGLAAMGHADPRRALALAQVSLGSLAPLTLVVAGTADALPAVCILVLFLGGILGVLAGAERTAPRGDLAARDEVAPLARGRRRLGNLLGQVAALPASWFLLVIARPVLARGGIPIGFAAAMAVLGYLAAMRTILLWPRRLAGGWRDAGEAAP